MKCFSCGSVTVKMHRTACCFLLTNAEFIFCLVKRCFDFLGGISFALLFLPVPLSFSSNTIVLKSGNYHLIKLSSCIAHLSSRRWIWISERCPNIPNRSVLMWGRNVQIAGPPRYSLWFRSWQLGAERGPETGQLLFCSSRVKLGK